MITYLRLYWKSHEEVNQMASWEICDGTPVTTEGSPLLGITKPDLRDRFMMGVTEGDLPQELVKGGDNTIAGIVSPMRMDFASG